ncbi:MAG: DEAD/DEAH box helicase [bacterium]|nr:DEAD/DEAH box helicase [bacterium]
MNISTDNKPSAANIDLDAVLRRSSSVISARGEAYYHQGRVEIDAIDSEGALLFVSGSQDLPYEVEMVFSSEDRAGVIFCCDCPYAGGRPGIICKHVVAAALKLKEYFYSRTGSAWRGTLDRVLQQGASTSVKQPKEMLLFSLQHDTWEWRIIPCALPLSHFDKEHLSDIKAVRETIDRKKLSREAKSLRYNYNADSSRWLQISDGLPSLIGKLVKDHGYYGLRDENIDIIIRALGGNYIYFGTEKDPLKTPLEVLPESGSVSLEVKRVPEGLRLAGTVLAAGRKLPLQSPHTQIISSRPVWLLSGSTLFTVDKPDQAEILLEMQNVVIPEEEHLSFYQQYLGPLAESLVIEGDALPEWRDIEVEPVPRLYLYENTGELGAELLFSYGEAEVMYEARPSACTVQALPDGSSMMRIHRCPEIELAFWKSLSQFGLKRGDEPQLFQLRKAVTPVDFICFHLPRLAENGFEVYGEENIDGIKVNRNTPRISIVVSSEIDWFDVKTVISFGDIELSLAEFRRAVKKRERYVKLADGSIGQLPQEWLDRYRNLFELGDNDDGGLRLQRSQVTLLEAVLDQADEVRTDADFEESRQRLRDFSSIEPVDLPSGFNGELRSYQKAGYDWLHFLHDYRLGGCLADDMGIGKTVQALTFLASLRESGHAQAASLIVMPRSLLTNWAREAERFTPELCVLTHADGDRSDDQARFNDYDLVLTTYGVLLRDQELLQQYRFHYVILDESQAIKNPLTHTGRAARRLSCDHRLVLTGTPVENSTLDLWSQFAFLNPGMLGSLDYFRKEFANPVERNRDEDVAGELRRLIYPFILRRTKGQVARELPPCTERTVYCEMEPAQHKSYTRCRDKYRAHILGMIETEGMNNARMKILEGLLRLRQICDHPALVDPDFKGRSAKMDVLMETVETLRAEGHKALVFSQFTKMLKVVEKELQGRGIPYVYLDGRTKDRQQRIDAFQDDPDIPLFLISLKAGGAGLNLTAADYVFHVDPWWNPAVERQATDRTHRIGQERPVFVHKLVVRDSVEEKILLLQERKKNLVDKLITAESGFFKSLTGDDVALLFS